MLIASRIKTRLTTFAITIILVMFGYSSYAQFYNGSNLTFGKNRVQYQKLNWFYYRNNRCDVYFYPQGKPIAQYALKYGNQEIEAMEQVLGYGLGEKIQFIVYATFADFKESNAGLINENLYNTGGNTIIAENKVFLYFNNGYRDFDKQIRAGVASIFINELINGTSLYSKIRSSATINLPDWFVSGLVSYYSEKTSPEIDNKIRDLIVSERYKKLTLLTTSEAQVAGHAFWSYVAFKYGANSIPSVLNMIHSARSVDKGFIYTLGISFEELYTQSLDFYNMKYLKDYQRSLPDSLLTIKLKKEYYYGNIQRSPDGESIAYISNLRGQYKIWIYNSSQKRPKRIFKRNHKIDENPDLSFPLLAWNPMGTILTFIIEEKGKINIYNYSIDDKKLSKHEVYNLTKVTSFAYSHDGKFLVFSAVKEGASDIFVYNLTSRSYTQITNDKFDDNDPQFIQQSSKILFSSNRVNDTIGALQSNSRSNLTGAVHLFVYDLKTKDNVLRRITPSSSSNETKPLELGKNSFLFLSDKNGINNSYFGRFDSTLSHIDTSVHYRFFTRISPFTDYRSSILEHNFSKSNQKYSTLILTNGINRFYEQEVEKFPTKFGTELSDGATQNELKFANDTLKTDTIQKKSRTKKLKGKRLVTVRMGEAYNDYPGAIFISGNQNSIQLGDTNTRQISIGDEIKPESLEQNAYVQYSISQIISQVDFSFMNTSYQQFTGGGYPIYLNPGFNALFMVGTQDLLENHRLIGGMRFTLNFDNTEFMLSYESLEKRLDRQIVLHRQELKQFNDYYGVKQVSNSVYYILKWPFSPVSAIRGTILGRADKEVFLSLENNSLIEPNRYGYWSGLKGEWIFDNSRQLANNIYDGTRAKVFAEYYQSIEKSNKSMVVVGADARHYLRIYRNFIWANRIAGSTSFGKNKLVYYMGGVDNWLFAKFNQYTNISTDQNYTFQTLATNMRGFIQNVRNGNSFAVINSELRIPFVKFIVNKSFNSDFLNNLQANIFGDIGTAWTGPSPYSEENSLYTQIITRGPIQVKLDKQIEPIVGGYGFGLRSKLLGYFIRADWAWGIENYKQQKPVFYLSLNLDF